MITFTCMVVLTIELGGMGSIFSFLTGSIAVGLGFVNWRLI